MQARVLAAERETMGFPSWKRRCESWEVPAGELLAGQSLAACLWGAAVTLQLLLWKERGGGEQETWKAISSVEGRQGHDHSL